MLLAAILLGSTAYASYSAGNSTTAFILAILALVALIYGMRRRKARRQGLRETGRDDFSLHEWRNSPSQAVTRPRDPRSKHCVRSIGKEIRIVYRSRVLAIQPLRVYIKPKYRKTYVDAVVEGEQRTFDIDDMTIA